MKKQRNEDNAVAIKSKGKRAKTPQEVEAERIREMVLKRA